MSEASNNKAGLKYRADIDGLRAVAVLSVLAFHIGGRYVHGGFVGVDVFFVISGYLISAIIFSEIAGSRFSVLAFYERRVRRIFPALFGMLIVFSIVASFLLLPTEFVDFANSLLAAITSCSNFYFWQHSGYFAALISTPLLHTWSLAVEEQFYILFPIFLVLVRRFFPQRLRTAVVVLFFLSLLASAVIVPYSVTTAFYMPYTRAWELLLGTILSLGMFPRLESNLLRNVAAFIGMGLIFYSVLFYSVDTPFPGLAALVPCLGSVLIIGAGEIGPSLVGRVLSWRPVVFIGLISYSLYLWHWPVIVVHTLGLSINVDSVLPHRIAAHLPPLRFDMMLEIVESFFLAILSWRFIERPFRSRPLRITRRPLFALSAAVMCLMIAFSGCVIFAGGFPGRFPPQSARIASFLARPIAGDLGPGGNCFEADSSPAAMLGNDRCLGLVQGKKNYLLIGDSHAATIWSGLQSSLPEDHFLLVSISNCVPAVHAGGASDCRKGMNYIFQTYLLSHAVEGLLLEARWKPNDMAGLTETVDWARRRHLPVMVLGPVQDYDAPLPRLLAYSIAWNKPGLAGEHRLAISAVIDAQMQSLAESTWHVPYISLYKAICNADGCTEYADAAHDVPLVNDSGHFNDMGSALIVRRLIDRGELSDLVTATAARKPATNGQ
jgi:peptidoglycan/LPS O-acetylase OafA/YrhL